MEKQEKQRDSGITRYGSLSRPLRVAFLVLTTVGLGVSVYYLFTFNIGGYVFLDTAFYYVLIATFFPLIFLLLPARRRDKRVAWYDMAASLLAFGIASYFFVNAWEINQVGWNPPSPLNFALAAILCLLVIEGGRRTGGPVYVGVVVVVGLYPIFADLAPGILYGFSHPLPETVALYAFGTEGLLGLPTSTTALLIGYLVFAGVLLASGAGRFFIDLALSVLGAFRGGPAKVSVFSSALFGTLTGSVVSNIVATGTVTIPAMKRSGYSSDYAAAVEACSSTGGIIMPPVMGATVFVMAVFLRTDYASLIAPAAIPAILYYFGLLMQVDARAAKMGIRGLPRKELPSLVATLRDGWPFLFVIGFLLWGLMYMRWSIEAPYYAAALLVALSFRNRKHMMTPRVLAEAWAEVGRLIAHTMAVLLPIGMITGGIVATGTAFALTASIVTIGQENVYIILLMGVAACYVMGMAGLSLPAYIFLAVTMAPAAVQVGNLDPVAVHLLIVYYSIYAMLTPPVATAAFVAASLAGAPPMKTAFTTMRLGIVLYFVPFFFVFNPSLILHGPVLETVYVIILALLGITLVAGGLEGYLVLLGRIPGLTRVLLTPAGLLIAFPAWRVAIIGLALAAVAIGLARIRARRVPRLVANDGS